MPTTWTSIFNHFPLQSKIKLNPASPQWNVLMSVEPEICLQILSMDNSTPDSSDEGSYLQETMSQAPASVIHDLSPLVGIQDSDARVRKPTPSRARSLSNMSFQISAKRRLLSRKKHQSGRNIWMNWLQWLATTERKRCVLSIKHHCSGGSPILY